MLIKLPDEIIYNIIYNLKLKDIKEIIKINKKFYSISNEIIKDKLCRKKNKKFNKYVYINELIIFLKNELNIEIYNRVNIYSSKCYLYYKETEILFLNSSLIDNDISIASNSPFIKNYILKNLDISISDECQERNYHKRQLLKDEYLLIF